jgi:hypothetical protein
MAAAQGIHAPPPVPQSRAARGGSYSFAFRWERVATGDSWDNHIDLVQLDTGQRWLSIRGPAIDATSSDRRVEWRVLVANGQAERCSGKCSGSMRSPRACPASRRTMLVEPGKTMPGRWGRA